MTVRNARTEPCWEVWDLDRGEQYGADDGGWPHFETRAKAAEWIAQLIINHSWDEWQPRMQARQAFDRPCVEVVCDATIGNCKPCPEVWDFTGEDATHCDPADPFPIPIEDCDWAERGDKHYCPEHVPPCDDDDDEDLSTDWLEKHTPVHPDQLTLEVTP